MQVKPCHATHDACAQSLTTVLLCPSQYVLVTLKTDVPVMFAGTEEPAAYGDLHSIGAIGGEKNKEVSSTLQ